VTVDGLSVHLRKRAFDTLRYVVHANVSGNVPTYQPEAVDRMKAFLNEPSWLLSQDDLKRELSEIRRAFGEAGIVWRPGQRTQSLLLPPFELLD
jgi:hypothetical protein